MTDYRNLIIRDEYDVGGWCFDPKRNLMESLISEINAQLCVEIGVYKGSSLLCLTEFVQKTGGKVIGIDPWSIANIKNEIYDPELSKYIFEELLAKQETMDKLYSGICEIIQNNGLFETVSIVRKPSEDAFLDFEINSIDLIHIDGNHDEINVSRDILLYLPFVKPGGYIIMDDCSWPGVKKAISRYLEPYADMVHWTQEFSCYKKYKVNGN